MTATEIRQIKRYLNKAYEGVEEYAETLEDTWVITEWLDKILEIVEGEG